MKREQKRHHVGNEEKFITENCVHVVDSIPTTDGFL